jgi:hypothetical protein
MKHLKEELDAMKTPLLKNIIGGLGLIEIVQNEIIIDVLGF